MTALPAVLPSPHPRSYLSVLALGTASVVLFRGTLRELLALALSADAYSYIVLVPLISAFVIYLERRRVFAAVRPDRSVAVVSVLAVSLAIYAVLALRVARVPAEYELSTKVFSLLLVWIAGFAFCCGTTALRAARFPFLLLFLLVPLPSHLMEKIVTALQWGSAETAYLVFRLFGVPVFRQGVNFELPVVGIEVARECSSIHSACALFITGLLVGHLFARTLWAKVSLTLLTVPIAMLTNAVRITTLWFLATKVDIGFLYGNLHRNGGILFSLVSLSILMSFLSFLRKLERKPLDTPGSYAG